MRIASPSAALLVLAGLALAFQPNVQPLSAEVAVSPSPQEATQAVGTAPAEVQAERKKNKAKVLILGAGIAGVTAANILAESGVTDFLLVEASDYIGGRLKKGTFAGRTIELGANWIEGLGKNPINLLAKQFGLKTVPSDSSNITLINQDRTLGGKVYEEALSRFEKAYEAASERGQRYKDSRKQDLNVRTALQYEGWTALSPIEKAVEFMGFDFEFAEPPAQSSLKMTTNVATFTKFSDESEFVVDPKGYSLIARELLDRALKAGNKGQPVNAETDPRVKLNSKVISIDYSGRGVTVKTENGQTYSADYAICTFSVGVLKHKMKTLFSPALPEWKTDEIIRFGMATYTKIFLAFEKNFWTNGHQFSLYADPKARGYYPVWMDLDISLYGDFAGRPGSAVYMVTVTDEQSRRIERMKDEEVQAEVMEVLRAMYGPDIPEPNAFFFPRWYSDDLFYGSYSNWPIGMTTENLRLLQKNVERLHFAGEHTSLEYNGYVHGGFLSGVRVAKELLKKMQKPMRSTLKDVIVDDGEGRN